MFNLLEPQGRQRLSMANFGEVVPYFQARQEILHSWYEQLWLIRDKSWYEIRDEVLYVYKDKQFYGRKISYLTFPPMTLDWDLEKELELLKAELQSQPAVVSTTDLENYSELRDKSTFKLQTKQNQYVYHTADFPDELTGKPWRKWRYVLNRFETDGYTMEVYVGDEAPPEIWPEIREVVQEWTKHKKRYPVIFLWIDNFYRLAGTPVVFIFRDKNGVVVGYTINQAGCYGLNTVQYSDEKYSRERIPPTFSFLKGVHVKICQWWRDYFGHDVYLNKGRDVDTGMKDAKGALRPYDDFRIYKLTYV